MTRADAAYAAGRAAFAAPLVPNVGQADPAVRFETRSPGGAVFFTAREIVLVRRSATIRRVFAGRAAPTAVVEGVGRLRGVVNYVRGDPTRWRTRVPTYAGARYRGLYAGIDVGYAVDRATPTPWVEATYTIAAGARPESIGWRYLGAAGVAVDHATGTLRVTVAENAPPLVEPAPAAWQDVAGRRVPVTVSYRVRPDRTVGFVLGAYDRSRTLLIGPAHAGGTRTRSETIGYSTFLGGANWDEAYAVEADAAGNAYVAGFTTSPDFPTSGAGGRAFAGVVDAFVTKLSADGHTVLFSTYLGGSKVDVAHSLALDSAGNAYVAGRTESMDFPIVNPLGRTLRGRECQRAKRHEPAFPCHDAFITKLSPTGVPLYSTYFGGSQDDEALGIAVDRAGSAYIIGNTTSTDLPTKRAVQRRFGPVPCPGDMPCPWDVFVTKLTPRGNGIVYSTYLGGKGSDRAGGIAVDAKGSAYVTGTTRSLNFPVRNAFQPRLNGVTCGPPPVPCPDAFVAKLSTSGSRLVYSTYLGGTDPENAGGIAVDRAGNAYVTGHTRSRDFPVANAVQATLDNSSCSKDAPPKELCEDVFVTKFDASGRSLAYSTYLSGNADEQGLAIALDAAGEAVVAGSTSSRNFRTVAAAQPAFGGYIDVFVAKLAADGRALVFSTYLGGSKAERGNGVAVGRDGSVYVAGRTLSANFPTTAGVPQAALRGDIDVFVARLK